MGSVWVWPWPTALLVSCCTVHRTRNPFIVRSSVSSRLDDRCWLQPRIGVGAVSTACKGWLYRMISEPAEKYLQVVSNVSREYRTKQLRYPFEMVMYFARNSHGTIVLNSDIIHKTCRRSNLRNKSTSKQSFYVNLWIHIVQTSINKLKSFYLPFFPVEAFIHITLL